jgi:formylglycine-generating enzyme required for sulfatase activity
VSQAFWYQPFGPGSTLHQKRNHPVVQVSLKDAMAFAAWTGKRLPSEFEWESAARTDSGSILPWGDDWQNDLCNTEDSAIADTTPVDNYPDSQNSFGVADTMGNVLEWTAEKWVPAHCSEKKTSYHIAKGGCWISDSSVRLYSRFRFETDFTANILGFRCAAD